MALGLKAHACTHSFQKYDEFFIEIRTNIILTNHLRNSKPAEGGRHAQARTWSRPPRAGDSDQTALGESGDLQDLPEPQRAGTVFTEGHLIALGDPPPELLVAVHQARYALQSVPGGHSHEDRAA